MLALYQDYRPFFSVIICSFNRADVLDRALTSLVEQEERDWEALVVDDGSNDETFKIVKQFSDEHHRIRYLYHSNKGAALARNTGIQAAAGLFVTFLDSDDWYAPEHLALRKICLQEAPEIDLLHGGVIIHGDPYVPDRFDPGKRIHLKHCVIGGTFVIRRDAALAIEGFPALRYSDDNAFFTRAMANGLTVAEIDAPTYHYDRRRADSLCRLVASGGVDAIEKYINDSLTP